MPEWLKGPVSKTGVPLRGTVGSNPTSSADCNDLRQRRRIAPVEVMSDSRSIWQSNRFRPATASGYDPVSPGSLAIS